MTHHGECNTIHSVTRHKCIKVLPVTLNFYTCVKDSGVISKEQNVNYVFMWVNAPLNSACVSSMLYAGMEYFLFVSFSKQSWKYFK